MIREALEFLRELTTQADGVEIVKIEGDARRVIVNGSDGCKFIDLPAALRSHTVYTLPDLITAAKHWMNRPRVIYHNPQQVVLLLDDQDRRDRVTMALTESAPFKTLRELASGRSFNQDQLVRLLKHDLYGCAEDKLLAIVRAVKFTNNSGSQRDIQHARDTFGKSVDAQVVGIKEPIPEYFFSTQPVYTNPGCDVLQTVRLSLDVEPIAGTFTIKPLPDQLADAVNAVQGFIHSGLLGAFEGDDSGDETSAAAAPLILYGSP